MVKRRPPGLSLIEVSLVMTLTLALMTLMASYFLQGQRYASETEAYSSVQRSANRLLRGITDDVHHSTKEQLLVDGDCLIFLSFADPEGASDGIKLDPTGRILWRKWVGYYHDPTQDTLYRGEAKLTGELWNLQEAAVPAVSHDLFRTEGWVKRSPLAGKVRKFVARRIDDRIRVSLTTWGQSPISVASNAQREIQVSVTCDIMVDN